MATAVPTYQPRHSGNAAIYATVARFHFQTVRPSAELTEPILKRRGASLGIRTHLVRTRRKPCVFSEGFEGVWVCNGQSRIRG